MPELNAFELAVVWGKATEPPFSGALAAARAAGVYVCRVCAEPLFRGEDRFEAGCGWPSFDAAIPGAVRETPDADGRRTEITCAKCGAHLGHMFTGEGFTPKGVRHCVNSVSLYFVPAGDEKPEGLSEAAWKPQK